MKIYTIYAAGEIGAIAADDDAAASRHAYLVPERGSLFALIFPWIWLIYHGIWDWGLGIAATQLFIELLTRNELIPLPAGSILSFGIGLLTYFNASYFIEYNLRRRGYSIAGVIAANSLTHAKCRLLRRIEAIDHRR